MSALVYSQGIDFYKEDITFSLDDKFFKIDGLYWFCNKADQRAEQLIFYPFETSSPAAEIDSVSIYNSKDNKKEMVKDLSLHGFKFMLELPANDTVIYRIGYRQKIQGDSVKYILTSTKCWNKPLDDAEYKLIVPEQFEITKFSYKPDKVYNIDGKCIYYWHRYNFMPESDMTFHFR